MTASRVATGRGRGRRKEGPNNKKNTKLKEPSEKLLQLITTYLYVPLSKVENVDDPNFPQTSAKVLFGRMDAEEDEESKEVEKGELGRKEVEHGHCYVDKASLAYYGSRPCRRQGRNCWDLAGASPRPSHGYGRGGMPGLARDVLRWLVALNLSFPIKNIKRDFSNGFMVAEIFSRYFPTQVHMHSYDYGSRAASKRDNWEQLNKFFKKIDFVVSSQEIENIIHCRTEEAVCQLLQRMYNVLTQKKCKPEDLVSKQFFQQQSDSCEQWNAEAPLRSPILSNCKQDLDQFSCSESDASSYNRVEYEEDMCYSRPRGPMSVEDIYHGDIKLDPRYESDSLLKMDDEEYSLDFTTFPENTAGFSFRKEEPAQNNWTYSQASKNKGSNAIEKAREKEVKKEVDRAKAGVRGDKQRFAEVARKARVEAGLAFRSPHRERTYKQYTLPDYRQQMQFGYVELGRLGPGDPSPELVVQRGKLAQRKQFGHHARSCNIMSHTNPTLVDYSKTVKMDAASSRKKALAFASKIPKPKIKIPTKDAQENLLPLQNPHAMSDLQILEAKHQSDKLHIENIRRDLEQFLR